MNVSQTEVKLELRESACKYAICTKFLWNIPFVVYASKETFQRVRGHYNLHEMMIRGTTSDMHV